MLTGRSMKGALAAAGGLLLATPGLGAGVVRYDLPKIVRETEGAVVGTILEVTATERVGEGWGPWIFTHVRIQGENLYTGEAEEVVVSFLGGTLEGRVTVSPDAPSPGDLRLGRRVVAFYAFSPTMGGTGMTSLAGSHAGLFRVEGGPRGEIVLGRGEGYAIEKTRALGTLRAELAALRSPLAAGEGVR
jgi:hypothetical protein